MQGSMQTQSEMTSPPALPFSWAEQYRARQAIAERFGNVYALPIRKRIRQVLLANVRDGDRVLEVGAGDRSFSRLLVTERRGVTYHSQDPDPTGDHEFARLDEASGAYDVVFAFEVSEHLPLEVLDGWLAQLAALLRPGGCLLLSTPNTYYPPDFLRDATHRTPLCYDELGGLVERAGLHVTAIHRIYHDPVHRKLLRRYLFGWLFRMLGLDFARQIVLTARRL